MNYLNTRVSVSIVTFNQNDSLRECLRSISSQSHANLEIVIVNNSQEKMSLNPQNIGLPVKVISNKTNLFYAKAQNSGIKESSGEFVLCLNDDVVLDVNFIKNALRGFKKDSTIGMVSGKVLSFYDIKIIDSTGLFLARSRKPLDRGYKTIDQGQYSKEGYVFGVPGAVGIYKRQMLEDTSINKDFFDSRFGIFYEDLDLCWRARNKGWRAYYIPEAKAYHKRGKTVKANAHKTWLLRDYSFCSLSEDLQLMLIKNRYRTIVKNDKWEDFLKNFIFILGYELKLWFYVLIIRPNLAYRLFKNMGWLRDSFNERNLMKTTFHQWSPPRL